MMLKKSLALSAMLHLMVIMALVFGMHHTTKPPKPKPVVVMMVPLPPSPQLPQKITQPTPPPPTPPKRVLPQKIPTIPSVTNLPVAKEQPKTVVPVVTQAIKPTAVSPSQTPTPLKPTPPLVDTTSIKKQYLGYVRQSIEEHKTYPKNAKRLGQTGTVEVTFTIMADGTIANITITQSSNFTLLDAAAREILIALVKVRPIPKELAKDHWEITFPIKYELQ